MGLFNWVKDQFIDVIEWLDDSNDTLVWRFPDQNHEIKNGAKGQAHLMADILQQDLHINLIARTAQVAQYRGGKRKVYLIPLNVVDLNPETVHEAASPPRVRRDGRPKSKAARGVTQGVTLDKLLLIRKRTKTEKFSMRPPL